MGLTTLRCDFQKRVWLYAPSWGRWCSGEVAAVEVDEETDSENYDDKDDSDDIDF